MYKQNYLVFNDSGIGLNFPFERYNTLRADNVFAFIRNVKHGIHTTLLLRENLVDRDISNLSDSFLWLSDTKERADKLKMMGDNLE